MQYLARLLIALLLVVAASPGLLGAAQEATPVVTSTAEDLLLSPDEPIAGMSWEELNVRLWQRELTFPEAISPLTDPTGERCGYGQQGPVFFVSGSILEEPPDLTCLVPANMPIAIAMLGANCSTVETPPFFGGNEAELGACLDDLLGGVEATQTLTINGVEISNELIERYRFRTPMFTVALPEGNIWGVPATVAEVMAESYAVLLAPLPPGEHVVVATIAVADFGFVATVTSRLVVTEPTVFQPQEDQGAPAA